MNTLTLSPADIATLRAARDVIDRTLAQVQAPQPVRLSRGPDGVHLDERGVKTLYAGFDAGMSAYDAHRHFDISYRAAHLRRISWQRKRAKAA